MRDGSVRVFISSASGAVVPYRRAAIEVCHRLGVAPIFSDETDPPSRQQRRNMVESCDLAVLLLGDEFGARPPGEDQSSYLELEYEWAAGKRRARILPYAVGRTDGYTARFATVLRTRHGLTLVDSVAVFRHDLLAALVPYSTEASPAPAPPIPAPPAVHAVPPYVGSAPFTGRAGDLDTLDAWGASADPVLVIESIGGIGKSALTWEWTQNRAPDVIKGLAGRLWWSFYGGSASITRFLHEALAYLSGQPLEDVRRLGRTELTDQVLAALRARPSLLVLDGFERLLAAFHRFDPSKLRDEDVEPVRRSLIEPHADEVIRALATAGPSKILISTRLMPDALEGRFGRRTPGVAHLRLPGLPDADTLALLERLGVRGDPAAITAFFHGLDNHPLLVGIVAGLIRDYAPDPGAFDAWLADQAGSAGLVRTDLDLAERRAHLLDAALAGVPADHRRLLGWISVLPGAVDWATLDAINPFRPPDTPAEEWGADPAAAEARAKLDAALVDLADRGLLWWDRTPAVNAYDLHPIVRAYVHDQLEDVDRIEANDRIRDHFQALPRTDPAAATSVEDLRQTITLFYALLGAQHVAEASAVWTRALGDPLLLTLGAASTVVELLTPLAADGSRAVRADLAIAYLLLGQYKVALAQDTSLLADALLDRDVEAVARSLGRLAVDLAAGGAELAATRVLDLYQMLRQATGGEDDDRWLLGERGIGAIRRGQLAEGLALLDRAAAGSAADGDLRYWQLYAALTSGTLTADQLADDAGDWRYRRRVLELRRELAIRAGQLEAALSADAALDRLDRDAGRETAPATSALLLARLGRRDEAQDALADAVERMSRLHPATRPHRRVAQALLALDRANEAAEQAKLAYRQAWRDGPPYANHHDLQDARALLDQLGEPEPRLRTADPTTITVPLESEVRAFIGRV